LHKLIARSIVAFRTTISLLGGHRSAKSALFLSHTPCMPAVHVDTRHQLRISPGDVVNGPHTPDLSG
jgi:hypothetical protein